MTRAGFHQWQSGDATHIASWGSFEIFQADDGDWYWWPCFPSCLPDGDAVGPFDSDELAWLDAITT